MFGAIASSGRSLDSGERYFGDKDHAGRSGVVFFLASSVYRPPAVPLACDYSYCGYSDPFSTNA